MPSAPDLPTPQGQSLLYSNKELPRPHLTAAVLGLATQKTYLKPRGLWIGLLALLCPRFTALLLHFPKLRIPHLQNGDDDRP